MSKPRNYQQSTNSEAPVGVEQIREWLVKYFARTLGVEPASIDTEKSFDQLGLESVMLVVLTEELTRVTGHDIDPVVPYDYPTINALASFVARGAQVESSGV